MITKIKTIEKLKNDFIIALRNNCGNKITKVLADTVANGFAYGFAKIAQDINTDVAYVESKLFPEFAFGTSLDDIGKREGIPTRLIASKPSVICAFKANNGTTYPVNTIITGSQQIQYKTDTQLVIGTSGIGYMSATASNNGSANKVDAYTLNTVISPPIGHLEVINPQSAVGGYDDENDYEYRNRILNIDNILALNTKDFYYEIINYFQPDALRIIINPTNYLNANIRVIVVRNNGGAYTNSELLNIKNQIIDYLPLRDANYLKLSIENINWAYVDINAKIFLDGSRTLLQIIQDYSMALNDYINYKYWNTGQRVDFFALESMLLNISGIKDIDDTTFIPNHDVVVSDISLPRLRNIILVDAENGTSVNDVFDMLRLTQSNRNFKQFI